MACRLRIGTNNRHQSSAYLEVRENRARDEDHRRPGVSLRDLTTAPRVVLAPARVPDADADLRPGAGPVAEAQRPVRLLALNRIGDQQGGVVRRALRLCADEDEVSV